MANSQHIIELNGKNYDASTGKSIGASHSTAQKSSAPKRIATASATKLVDGIRAPRKSTAALRVGHAPEHSKTLMRHVVKKPVVLKAESHPTPKTTTKVAHAAPAEQSDISQAIKPERLLRAATTPKSTLISKFGRTKTFGRTDIVPVKPAPQSSNVKKVSAPTEASKTPNAIDQISAALEKADGHLQPKIKQQSTYHRLAKKLHVSPVILAGGATGLIVLAIGGWLAINNVPNIAMRVAATRAGIHATLPSYHPSGFGLQQPISYSSGEVNLKFTSNSDNRTFNIVQKSSTWDSQALFDNIVSKHPYQVIQSNGRTVYIYNNIATWVDGGTWYQINGDTTLNSDQLLKIADSL